MFRSSDTNLPFKYSFPHVLKVFNDLSLALKEVENNKLITELDLSYIDYDLNIKNINKIVFRLRNNDTLRTLNLGSVSMISLAGLEALLRMLRTTNITRLVLTGGSRYPNDIHRERIKSIMSQLKLNEHLNNVALQETMSQSTENKDQKMETDKEYKDSSNAATKPLGLRR